MKAERERGFALLVVLIVVVVVSALAVSLLDDIRFGIRRTRNSQTLAQSQWYAVSAETFARTRLLQLASLSPEQTATGAAWLGQWTALPVEGGTARVRIADATTCFNLNSVVEADVGEPFRRRDLGVQQFVALLEALNIPNAQTLADNVADWIDTNDVSAGGAEDASYLQGPAPYRTASDLLTDPSELRAIQGFDPEIFARVRPWVCALPTADLSPINVNALRPEQALIVTAVTRGSVEAREAQQMIASRPRQGWSSAGAFLDQPFLKERRIDPVLQQQLQVRMRFAEVSTLVEMGGSEHQSTALLEVKDDAVTTRSRAWTTPN